MMVWVIFYYLLYARFIPTRIPEARAKRERLQTHPDKAAATTAAAGMKIKSIPLWHI